MFGRDWGWAGRFGSGCVGGGAWGDRISIAKNIPSNRRILADTPRGPVALRERHGPEPHLSWDRRGVARWERGTSRGGEREWTEGAHGDKDRAGSDPIGHGQEEARTGLSLLYVTRPSSTYSPVT